MIAGDADIPVKWRATVHLVTLVNTSLAEITDVPALSRTMRLARYKLFQTVPFWTGETFWTVVWTAENYSHSVTRSDTGISSTRGWRRCWRRPFKRIRNSDGNNRPIRDVVGRERFVFVIKTSIFEEDALLQWGYFGLVLDLGLRASDGVVRPDIQSVKLSVHGLDENLHKGVMNRWFVTPPAGPFGALIPFFPREVNGGMIPRTLR